MERRLRAPFSFTEACGAGAMQANRRRYGRVMRKNNTAHVAANTTTNGYQNRLDQPIMKAWFWSRPAFENSTQGSQHRPKKISAAKTRRSTTQPWMRGAFAAAWPALRRTSQM